MRIRLKDGIAVREGRIENLNIYIEENCIAAVTEEILPAGRVVSLEGNYVSAGWIDLHCHGGGGADFNDGDRDAALTAARTHLAHGTTSIFPTMAATEFGELERALDAVAAAAKILPSIRHAHLEGPYLSPAQCGAQKGETLCFPDADVYRKFLERGDIARWDYAPELDPEFRFLDDLKAAGVIPAAAHTDADCTTMERAFARGCGLITHLYSCTSTIRRQQGFRIAGVTEAAYLCDGLCSELIADGRHLPDELLRLAYRGIGAERLALVTDAMRAAGTSERESIVGKRGKGVPCIIEDNVAKLPDRSAFAGSVATADRLLKTCVGAGIPLAEGIRMLTETPARIMSLSRKGRLLPGFDADLVVFNEKFEVQKVILQGEILE